MPDAKPPTSSPDSAPLTWAALLAHWVAFAQSSLALPKNAEGDRWRSAVPAIIGLQAHTHALAELDRLAPEEDRAAAIDRAAIAMQAHAAQFHELWRSEPLHPELSTLIDDARAALHASQDSGVEWTVSGDRLVVDHPGDVLIALADAGFAGDVYLPVPGTVLFKNSPCAFARAPGGAVPDPAVTGLIRGYLNEGGGASKHSRVPAMRQVYRQFDFGKGRVVRDLVRSMNSELPAGQAQLVPALLAGVPQPVTLPIPGMANQDPVPVVFEA